MAQLKTIQSLQAGRGLAALYVVLHHSDLAAADFGAGKIHVPLLANGYLGVDFFFVLSGFIIYHSTAGRDRSAADYARARLRRVYLPYLPIGIGIALLYAFVPGLSEGSRSWSWLPTLTLLPVSSETALSVAWTLKHEILFYLVFGCLYFSGALRAGMVIWGGLIAVAAMFGLHGGIPLALINLEFLMGVAIAILYRAGRGHVAWLLLSPIPLVIWILLGMQRNQSVLVGLALAMAMLPVAQLEEKGRLKVPSALTFLGAASYSIYLAHGVAISAISRLFRDMPYWLVAGGTMIAGVAAGLAYFFAVERPLLRLAPGDKRHQRLTGEELRQAAGGPPRQNAG
jgi:peptidoglycan/LPS O-acetylase OafA/YrhL